MNEFPRAWLWPRGVLSLDSLSVSILAFTFLSEILKKEKFTVSNRRNSVSKRPNLPAVATPADQIFTSMVVYRLAENNVEKRSRYLRPKNFPYPQRAAKTAQCQCKNVPRPLKFNNYVKQARRKNHARVIFFGVTDSFWNSAANLVLIHSYQWNIEVKCYRSVAIVI